MPQTMRALMVFGDPGTSMNQNHLQMTSDGSETCSIGFRRSKRPKIDPKNVQKGLL